MECVSGDFMKRLLKILKDESGRQMGGLIIVTLLGIISLFLLLGIVGRLVIVALIMGFIVFSYYADWQNTYHPGERVRIIRGEDAGLEGVVDLSDHKTFGPVYVLIRKNGEPAVKEYPAHRVEKVRRFLDVWRGLLRHSPNY